MLHMLPCQQCLYMLRSRTHHHHATVCVCVCVSVQAVKAASPESREPMVIGGRAPVERRANRLTKGMAGRTVFKIGIGRMAWEQRAVVDEKRYVIGRARHA